MTRHMNTDDESSMRRIEKNAREARVWIARARQLPPVRIVKVLAARESIRQHRYDGDDVLDATIDALAEDLAAP